MQPLNFDKQIPPSPPVKKSTIEEKLPKSWSKRVYAFIKHTTMSEISIPDFALCIKKIYKMMGSEAQNEIVLPHYKDIKEDEINKLYLAIQEIKQKKTTSPKAKEIRDKINEIATTIVSSGLFKTLVQDIKRDDLQALYCTQVRIYELQSTHFADNNHLISWFTSALYLTTHKPCLDSIMKPYLKFELNKSLLEVIGKRFAIAKQVHKLSPEQAYLLIDALGWDIKDPELVNDNEVKVIFHQYVELAEKFKDKEDFYTSVIVGIHEILRKLPKEEEKGLGF